MPESKPEIIAGDSKSARGAQKKKKNDALLKNCLTNAKC